MASIVAKILGDGKGFDKTMAGVQGRLAAVKKGFGSFSGALGGIALGGFVKSLIETGSNLTDVADKLGVSTDFLQEFNFAARENGVATTASEMGLQRFVRRLGEAQQGTGELLPTLKQYGIALFDSTGKARGAQEVLADYADTVKAAGSRQEQLRLAFKAFDSEGAALVTVLDQGAAGMEKMFGQARKLGQVMSEEQARRMDVYADRIGAITVAVKTMSTELLGKGIGAVESFGEALGGLLFGTEDSIIDDGFEETAERMVRFGEEVVKVKKNISAGQGYVSIFEEFVNRGGEFIPIQDAINEKVGELKKKAVEADEAYAEIGKTVGGVSDQEGARLAQANALEVTNENIQKILSDSAAVLVSKILPADEKILQLQTRIAEQAAIVGDATALGKDREAAAKRMAALQKDLLDTTQSIVAEEEKKTAELEKQRTKLEQQAGALQKQLGTLKSQSAEFEKSGQFGATFQEIAAGGFGDAAARDAARVSDLQERARQALFFGGEDSQAFKNASGFANTAQTNFEDRYGVDPVENPFKESLKDTEDELKELNKKVEAL